MAPQDLTELKAIIEIVNAPMQRALDRALGGQDELRREILSLRQEISHLSNNQVKQEERIVVAEKDAKELSEQMADIKKTLLEHQQKKFKQTIALQATIILLVLGAFVSYLVPLLFHH